ncbi:MAG: AzlC family ABC transporter permease [Chloroflexota bacterium]
MTRAVESNRRREFLAGARDIMPLVIGALPFGILYGVVCLTAGVPWWAAQAMSAFVFAGSAQFIAAGLVGQGTPFPFIVLTTFIVNLRHALYGASVAPYLRGLPAMWRAFLAFGLTDESYATTIVHYRDETRGDAANKHWYFLGANITMYVFWQADTALGYWIGTALGDPLALGLDFVLPVVFIAILVPQLKSRSTILSALVAGAVAVLAAELPNKLGLLIAIAAGILAGMVTEKWNSRS